MSESALTAVLRRDRTIVAASLLALCAVAWAYVLWLVQAMRMGGMQMTGMRVDANPFEVAMIAAVEPWSTAEFAFAFVMWAVMMIGMMTPSAAPMILIYARVGRQAELQGKPLAATGYFAGGYLLAWAGFALAATGGQWLLERASLLTPMMASASGILGGLVLVAATPRWGDWFLPFWPIPDDRIDYLRALRPVDPIERIGSVGTTPVLFQFARADFFIAPMTGLEFRAAAPDGAELQAYDDEHGMRRPEVRADREAFLRRVLGLGA